MHDTRTPVIAGIAIMALNVIVGVALLDRLGYLALALALSLSTTVEALILIAILGRRIGGVSRKTRDWLLKLIATSAVTALVAALLATPLTEATTPGNGPKLQQIVVFLFTLAVVAVVYLGCAWMLRIPELSGFVALLTRRIGLLGRLASVARR
jgi:putative peptidoglycan lipid II flippase